MNGKTSLAFAVAALGAGIAFCANADAAKAAKKGAVKVYPHYMEPRNHPDDSRRLVRPPNRKTFGEKLQFMALREMGSGSYKRDLDRYVSHDNLGNLVWAGYRMIYNKNFREQLEELKKRNLFLFDLWGFVPGSGPGKTAWEQYPVPPGTYETLEEVLGDNWLGMDNGEQDGRYTRLFTRQQVPNGVGRYEQYLNFQRHFEKMDRLQGNKLASLVALNFGHYFLREGCYTMLGAETAQALPNSQVYYSFIRGAGKQYGVPWFGNVSVFNKWGWKAYTQKDDNPKCGPDKGTSLALMKKLLYTHIFYNCLAVGYENGFYWSGKYTKDGHVQLSPIGQLQQNAVKWSEKNGDPGVMHAPVAVMLDFYSGWSFPRHLFSGMWHEIGHGHYSVWGALPYEEGDYLTDGVLDMLYPGYQDASFYRDERGFYSDTPYGDIADCLLSDAPAWLLKQYPLLILGGAIAPSAEIKNTLEEYMRAGGHLVLTQGNLDNLKLEATGRMTVIPSKWGITEKPVMDRPLKSETEKPLDRHFPLTDETRKILDGALREQMIFSLGDSKGLGFVTCRRKPGEYTLCVVNNTWSEQPMKIEAAAGKILSIEELPVVNTDRGQIGFAPHSISNIVIGADTPTTIAAGSTRTFRVMLDETGAIEEKPAVASVPNPKGRTLALRRIAGPIKEEIMARPTFFRHYDSVMVDARYVLDHDREFLRGQTDWLRKQGMEVIVDLSPLMNLFPDYNFMGNIAAEDERTEKMKAELMEKLEIFGVKKLLAAPHRIPETNIDWKIAQQEMVKGLKKLAQCAAKKNITLYIRHSLWRSCYNSANYGGHMHWIAAINEPNCKFAPSFASLMDLGKNDPEQILKLIKMTKSDIWLMSASEYDRYGQIYSLHGKLSAKEWNPAWRKVLDEIRKCAKIMVADGNYAGWDDEWREARLLNGAD